MNFESNYAPKFYSLAYLILKTHLFLSNFIFKFIPLFSLSQLQVSQPSLSLEIGNFCIFSQPSVTISSCKFDSIIHLSFISQRNSALFVYYFFHFVFQLLGCLHQSYSFVPFQHFLELFKITLAEIYTLEHFDLVNAYMALYHAHVQLHP